MPPNIQSLQGYKDTKVMAKEDVHRKKNRKKIYTMADEKTRRGFKSRASPFVYKVTT